MLRKGFMGEPVSTHAPGVRITGDILMVRLVRPVAGVGVGGGHEVWSLGPGFPAVWPCVPAFCFRLSGVGRG